MKIICFDTKNGIYNFCLNELNSNLHAHPTIEIIIAEKGNFSLETIDAHHINLDFIIINSNVKHRVFSESCEVKMLMLESNNFLFFNFLKDYDLEEKSGIFTAKKDLNTADFFKEAVAFSEANNLAKVGEERVETCLQLFRNENLEYREMIHVLTSKTFLSESRLSHIFKEHIGISLKKYLVWSRLKKVVDLMLNEKLSLLEAGNAVGFYDQAHLSKSFKNILGISPSKAYNSRTVQV